MLLEIIFQLRNLLRQQIRALPDERDHQVGGDLVTLLLYVRCEGFPRAHAPQTPSCKPLLGVLRPFGEFVYLEIVEIVFEKLLKARFRDIGQLQLRFLACRRRLAALNDVLLAAPRCLHHLVDGAVAALKETPHKHYGPLKNDIALLVCKQPLVAAMRQYDLSVHQRTALLAKVGDFGDKGESPLSMQSPMSP